MEDQEVTSTKRANVKHSHSSGRRYLGKNREFMYNLEDRIGQGQFGTVYKGIQTSTQKTVAVKLFRITEPVNTSVTREHGKAVQQKHLQKEEQNQHEEHRKHGRKQKEKMKNDKEMQKLPHEVSTLWKLRNFQCPNILYIYSAWYKQKIVVLKTPILFHNKTKSKPKSKVKAANKATKTRTETTKAATKQSSESSNELESNFRDNKEEPLAKHNCEEESSTLLSSSSSMLSSSQESSSSSSSSSSQSSSSSSSSLFNSVKPLENQKEVYTQQIELHYIIVTEYCAGSDLQHRLLEHGKVDEMTARALIYQLANALYFLKQQRIIHRDIKPANILLTNRNMAKAVLKIADFGMAKVASTPPPLPTHEETPHILNISEVKSNKLESLTTLEEEANNIVNCTNCKLQPTCLDNVIITNNIKAHRNKAENTVDYNDDIAACDDNDDDNVDDNTKCADVEETEKAKINRKRFSNKRDKLSSKVNEISSKLPLYSTLFQSELGTPLYMSPERILGKPYGFKADVYSAGMILYELITGHPVNVRNMHELEHKVPRAMDALVREYGISCPSHELLPAHYVWLHNGNTAIPMWLDLLRKMTAGNPQHRLSIEDVLRHPWFEANNGQQSLPELSCPLPPLSLATSPNANADQCVKKKFSDINNNANDNDNNSNNNNNNIDDHDDNKSTNNRNNANDVLIVLDNKKLMEESTKEEGEQEESYETKCDYKESEENVNISNNEDEETHYKKESANICVNEQNDNTTTNSSIINNYTNVDKHNDCIDAINIEHIVSNTTAIFQKENVNENISINDINLETVNKDNNATNEINLSVLNKEIKAYHAEQDTLWQLLNIANETSEKEMNNEECEADIGVINRSSINECNEHNVQSYLIQSNSVTINAYIITQATQLYVNSVIYEMIEHEVNVNVKTVLTHYLCRLLCAGYTLFKEQLAKGNIKANSKDVNDIVVDEQNCELQNLLNNSTVEVSEKTDTTTKNVSNITNTTITDIINTSNKVDSTQQENYILLHETWIQLHTRVAKLWTELQSHSNRAFKFEPDILGKGPELLISNTKQDNKLQEELEWLELERCTNSSIQLTLSANINQLTNRDKRVDSAEQLILHRALKLIEHATITMITFYNTININVNFSCNTSLEHKRADVMDSNDLHSVRNDDIHKSDNKSNFEINNTDNCNMFNCNCNKSETNANRQAYAEAWSTYQRGLMLLRVLAQHVVIPFHDMIHYINSCTTRYDKSVVANTQKEQIDLERLQQCVNNQWRKANDAREKYVLEKDVNIISQREQYHNEYKEEYWKAKSVEEVEKAYLWLRVPIMNELSERDQVMVEQLINEISDRLSLLQERYKGKPNLEKSVLLKDRYEESALVEHKLTERIRENKQSVT